MKHINNWEIKNIDYSEKINIGTLLPMLADNQIAAVKISNFYTKEELYTIVNKINKQSIFWYPESDNTQGRIGLSAAEYCSTLERKALYFEQVAESSRIRDDFFSDTINPIQKINELFSGSHQVAVAREPNVGDAPYFFGLIRAMGAKSTLHFDFAPHQLPGWRVSESTEQFGLVLYLQMPVAGGELLVYNHPWKIEDDVYNQDKIKKGPYGFDPAFIADEIPARITPVAGDLVIFRTRNFHQIDENSPGLNQYRLTFNTFLALKDKALLLWS